MKEIFRKTRLRIELEVIPIDEHSEFVVQIIKDKFDVMLKDLYSNKLIDMNEAGASMVVVDITPFEWTLE